MQLSVITINLNNAEGLEKTIRSVVNQTYQDFEYIVIDGGSADDSVKVIKEYADKITDWVSEPDQGIYHAMNKGIERAKGEYLVFLNSGDHFHDENVLKNCVHQLTPYDIVTGSLMFQKGGSTKLVKPHLSVDIMTFYNSFIAHPSTFIKRTLFSQFGPYDISYRIAADHAFFYKVFSHMQVNYQAINQVISVSYSGGISTNKKNRALNRLERKKAFSQTPDFYLPFVSKWNHIESFIALLKKANKIVFRRGE